MEETRGTAGIANPVLGTALDELLADNHCKAGVESVDETGAFTYDMAGLAPGYYEFTAVAHDDFGGYRDWSKDALIFITGGKSFGVQFDGSARSGADASERRLNQTGSPSCRSRQTG